MSYLWQMPACECLALSANQSQVSRRTHEEARITGLTEKVASQELKLRLTRVLKDLLKPVKVKSLVITKSEGNTVHGIVMTVCPIERRESGRDFEVGLEGSQGDSIRYVMVDGRRLPPRRTKARTSRHSSSTH